MKEKYLIPILIFFVLGSAAISRIHSLSQTVKSFFYGTALVVLLVVGMIRTYHYFKS